MAEARPWLYIAEVRDNQAASVGETDFGGSDERFHSYLSVLEIEIPAESFSSDHNEQRPALVSAKDGQKRSGGNCRSDYASDVRTHCMHQ